MMTVHVTAQVAHKTIVQQVTTIVKQVVTMVHILINVPIKIIRMLDGALLDHENSICDKVVRKHCTPKYRDAWVGEFR